MNTNEKLIYSFLKNTNVELADKFKIVIAMARSKKDVGSRIINLSDTIFQHLILFVLFKKNKMSVPTNWSKEIQEYFQRIDAYNSNKKKRWFSAKEILKELDDQLVPKTKPIILAKLSKFSKVEQNKVKGDIDAFFDNGELSLKKLNIELKHINDVLTCFVNGIQI